MYKNVDIMTTLGEYIARKRVEKGLTQRDLAKRAGFSHGTLNKIENGLTSHPGIDVLMGISKALNVPITSLIAAYQGKDPDSATDPGSTEAYKEATRGFIEALPEEEIFALLDRMPADVLKRRLKKMGKD